MKTYLGSEWSIIASFGVSKKGSELEKIKGWKQSPRRWKRDVDETPYVMHDGRAAGISQVTR
jgi:hypothetical protein